MPRRAAQALVGVAAAVALLFLTWYLTFHGGVFQRADQSIFSGFAGLHHRPRLGAIANFVAHLCDPNPYVYFAAIPVLVALGRRRPRVAFAIGAILLGANVTTQLLKPLLAEPRAASLLGGVAPVIPASWPSGHATAAMSLALCSVLAAPSRLRPLVAALGAAFAVAVSYSFLTLGWHYPSDVFGGFLIAVTWTLLGAAAIFAADAKRRRSTGVTRDAHRLSAREVLGPPAAVVLGGLTVFGLVALARPHAVISYARVHTTFIIGAAAIGTLALALAIGVLWLSAADAPRARAAPRAEP
jgi:membrane-associated phospholipid phosphatase